MRVECGFHFWNEGGMQQHTQYEYANIVCIYFLICTHTHCSYIYSTHSVSVGIYIYYIFQNYLDWQPRLKPVLTLSNISSQRTVRDKRLELLQPRYGRWTERSEWQLIGSQNGKRETQATFVSFLYHQKASKSREHHIKLMDLMGSNCKLCFFIFFLRFFRKVIETHRQLLAQTEKDRISLANSGVCFPIRKFTISLG